jgi:putative cell wall-binding protein
VMVTDAEGYWARWVNDHVGELEVTAVMSGYFPETRYVVPLRGETVTTDVELVDTDCAGDPGPIPPQVDRIAGADRYATAVQVSQAYPPGVDTVFLATGQGFPDALAAASRAGSLHGPVLLTRQGSLPPVTAVELGRLQPANVVVVGGTAAVSEAVLRQVRSAAPGATVSRVAGADRFVTAALLAAQVPSSDVVYVASGATFPDALAASARAGALDAPMLLVRQGSVPTATVRQLERLGPDRIVLLGGPVAVSAAVEQQLGAYGTVERVYGADRYGTAAAVAEDWPTARDVYVATGEAFPDALTGSALAAHTGSPVLLVRSATVPASTMGSLQRLDPARIFVLGGPVAVSDAVLEVLSALR